MVEYYPSRYHLTLKFLHFWTAKHSDLRRSSYNIENNLLFGDGGIYMYVGGVVGLTTPWG